jgi:hypothetical protein
MAVHVMVAVRQLEGGMVRGRGV